jgi:hypothetical protein
MAGYKTPGADQFVNATTINSQIKDQRSKLEESNQLSNSSPDLGIARDVTGLFSFGEDNSLEDIFNQSVQTFNLLDLAAESGNPDFGPATTMSNNPGTLQMYNDVSNQLDKPNRKGPNLAAPDINDPTFTSPTEESVGSRFINKGFGWRDERNEPSTATARIGEYFSKHYKSDGESLNPPVFGEAKDPGAQDDSNINYDQP